ncbi:MAG: hypothetical protein QF654_03845 [Alphaproteobacteria bacterium]|mgnify:CR=1 FL=1|jgi:hypothetical protein|nr:hypothetical protein [Alphaproteobacteria bacterium]|tara:strand:+ start:246 stop:635 length:390 start_codon:yes stop_codon:yes gene_type:complete
MRIFGRSVVFLALALLLAACGDDDRAKRAEWAREWLVDYLKEKPLVAGLRAKAPRVSDKLEIVIDVIVESPEKVAKLLNLSKMEQVGILQVVCPKSGTKFWRILDDDQDIWVNLNGTDRNIITATCKRP